MSERTRKKASPPTLDEIRTWPATVDPPKAGTAFGISKSYSYELVKKGTFPARVLPVGGVNRVVTASILEILGPQESE